MRKILLSLPGKLQAAVIICSTIFIAFASAKLCSLFFDEHQLVINTDLISSVYEVMGTIYAILLTFTLWGVWQHFTEAGDSVQNEAYALLDLVHMLETSHETEFNKRDLRHAALTYAKMVVNEEWPRLKTLTNSCINLHEKNESGSLDIVKSVQTVQPRSPREEVIFGQTLKLLTRWLDARRTRLLIARGNSARALWPLLFTGAFVLFAFNGMFVAQSMLIWTMLLLGTSLVVGVTFYLIFTLDCPFSGSLSIDCEPFNLAIGILDRKISIKDYATNT